SCVTRGNLLDLGVSPGQVSVVYPPIDLDAFDADRPPAHKFTREVVGIPREVPCIGIIGQLQEWKGHKVFIRAFRQVLLAVPEAWACVVGAPPPGGEAYERELRDLARQLGVAERVVFVGFVGVIPSDEGGPREIIEHDRTGLLFPCGDDGALAESIVSLLRDRPRAQRLAEAGFAHSRERFSAVRHARLVESVYTEVLDSRTKEGRHP